MSLGYTNIQVFFGLPNFLGGGGEGEGVNSRC